ncbi:MAG: hypothetical protein GXO25_07025 [Euryarchaeota archaeon]|nr:hypothetical protein [Euryarchaeota archaeon]
MMMIQFFLSKVTVSILALSLIAIAIGYFVTFDNAAYQTEASELANQIASRIDEIAAQNMVEKVYFVYNETKGIHLPPRIGGQYYTLEIGTRIVNIRLRDFGYGAYIHSTVYTFNPDVFKGKKVTSQMLYNYELEHPLMISHTQRFCVDQRYMLVDGLWQYVTFVYVVD